MSDSHSLGQTGEIKAAAFLQDAGYRIRHRNWVSGKKELDIVAENDEFIVFVEVKTRTSEFLVSPSEAVTKEKQRSLIFAADGYIQKYGIDKESRFDIITVIVRGEKFEIEHIENAFYPTLK